MKLGRLFQELHPTSYGFYPTNGSGGKKNRFSYIVYLERIGKLVTQLCSEILCTGKLRFLNVSLLDNCMVHWLYHRNMDEAFSNPRVEQCTRNNITETVSQRNQNSPRYVIQADPALVSWTKNTTQTAIG
jgi:transcriptional regulator GlxA family with amidase domain